jgi:hypothetical protein
MSQQIDSTVGKLRMHVRLAMRNISSEEALSENFLGLGVRLINIILFIDDLLILFLLLGLIGMDDVFVVFVELVVGLVDLRR